MKNKKLIKLFNRIKWSLVVLGVVGFPFIIFNFLQLDNTVIDFLSNYISSCVSIIGLIVTIRFTLEQLKQMQEQFREELRVSNQPYFVAIKYSQHNDITSNIIELDEDSFSIGFCMLDFGIKNVGKGCVKKIKITNIEFDGRFHHGHESNDIIGPDDRMKYSLYYDSSQNDLELICFDIIFQDIFDNIYCQKVRANTSFKRNYQGDVLISIGAPLIEKL